MSKISANVVLFEEMRPENVVSNVKTALIGLGKLNSEDLIVAINEIRIAISEYSPFKSEPVDCVQWVESDLVQANDYNPNSVAPPEMELLRRSIMSDGYTQPIVTNLENDIFVVVDGFHRNRVGKECRDVKKRVKGYLPIVQIRAEQRDRPDRIAATIRHNRARGKHRVDGMSDIVIELKRRNWTNERICRELGMDEDEVLRLCQITGLVELFSDQCFSKSWDIEGEVTESDFKELSDNVQTYGEEVDFFRTVNTSDETRIFHTFDKWECYKAGFYNTRFDGKDKEECEKYYAEFLADLQRFEKGLDRVIKEWKHSCEHYLTNRAMNRIAWLGQAAMCIETGVPNEYRSGFFLLTPEQQASANRLAFEYLNKWMIANDRPEVTLEEALSNGRQSDIY